MYDRPELADAHRRYWACIRRELSAVGIVSPATLSQVDDETLAWVDPALVFSQTCGMPYRSRLRGKVTLIGTPDFGLDGCAPGYYRSAIVVRADDPRTTVQEFEDGLFVFNSTDSQSGYQAAMHHVAPLGLRFRHRTRSGSHAASAQAVADGSADIAALDAVSWRLMERYDHVSERLRMLTWTEPTPGLPYIAANGCDGGAMFDAVTRALATLSELDRDTLGICGLVAIPSVDYENVPTYR